MNITMIEAMLDTVLVSGPVSRRTIDNFFSSLFICNYASTLSIDHTYTPTISALLMSWLILSIAIFVYIQRRSCVRMMNLCIFARSVVAIILCYIFK